MVLVGSRNYSSSINNLSNYKEKEMKKGAGWVAVDLACPKKRRMKNG